MTNNIQYFRPTNVDDASALLGTPNSRTRAVAGGSSLAFDASINADILVDLSQLGLDQIERQDGQLHVGAMTNMQTLVENGYALPENDPLRLLCLAAHDMAAVGLRQRITLGGAIATADSASPIVTALLALNAEVLLFTPNGKDKRKTVALAGLLGYQSQVLKAGVLILGVIIPATSEASVMRYAKVARTPADYPIVCAASVCVMGKDLIETVRVAVGGVAEMPLALNQLGIELAKKPLSHLDSALASALAELNPPSNWLGSSDYRREMAGVLIKRNLS